MDWKVALLYVLFCLLTLALLLCGALLWLFIHRDRYAVRPADVSAVSSLSSHVAASEEEDGKVTFPSSPLLHVLKPEMLSPDSRKLWERLVKLMEEEEVWRNPDLTLNELSALLGTNRTRFCHLVQEAGYAGYKDYVNRYRIRAFLQRLEQDKTVSIQDAFFSVGYQSKMTALRHFKTYTGMTPTEYLNKVSLGGS